MIADALPSALRPHVHGMKTIHDVEIYVPTPVFEALPEDTAPR